MSSMLFLGLSVVAFIVIFGFLYLLMPIIFGTIYDTMDGISLSPAWTSIYEENKTLMEFLLPLMMALSIFILIIKVLMNATALGHD